MPKKKVENKGNLMVHNDFNKIVFPQEFTATDFNLFFTICLRLQGRKSDLVTISYDDIRKISDYRNGSLEDLTRDLKEVVKKLKAIDYWDEGKDEKNREVFRTYTFFPYFDAGYDEYGKGRLIVEISKHGALLLSSISKNFTPLDMQALLSLKSKYSKSLYRLLRQFRNTGEYYVKTEKFRALLGIPDGYKNRDIMEKVIKPTVKALEPYFPELTVEAVQSGRQGHPVVEYDFFFKVIDEQQSFSSQEDINRIANDMKKDNKRTTKKTPFEKFQASETDYKQLEKILTQ